MGGRGNGGHGGDEITGVDYFGEDGNESHITRNEEGMISTSALRNLEGKAGEKPGQHRNKTGAAWTRFVNDIKANGVKEPIFITKDWNGKARISEGNHRRDAAIAAGVRRVPVHITYYGNAQKQGLVR